MSAKLKQQGHKIRCGRYAVYVPAPDSQVYRFTSGQIARLEWLREHGNVYGTQANRFSDLSYKAMRQKPQMQLASERFRMKARNSRNKSTILQDEFIRIRDGALLHFAEHFGWKWDYRYHLAAHHWHKEQSELTTGRVSELHMQASDSHWHVYGAINRKHIQLLKPEVKAA